MQCTYDNGRQCPKQATHQLMVNGSDFAACNGHRIALANQVMAQVGPIDAVVRLELAR